jgi:hypothetical protein
VGKTVATFKALVEEAEFPTSSGPSEMTMHSGPLHIPAATQAPDTAGSTDQQCCRSSPAHRYSNPHLAGVDARPNRQDFREHGEASLWSQG